MIQYGIIGEKLSADSDAVAAPPPERTENDKIHYVYRFCGVMPASAAPLVPNVLPRSLIIRL